MAVKKKKVITMQEYIQKNDIKPTYNLTDIAPVKKTTSFYGSPTIVEDLGNLISVSKNEDFKENSGYVSTKSDKFLEKLGSKYGMGYTDLQYEYINNQNDIRDEIDRKAVTWSSDTGDKSASFKDKALEYMTEEEVGVYNYYYKTEGKEKAQKFLDTLAETLSNRKAGVEFEDIQGKTAREILYGTVSGTEQFKQGIKNVGNMVVGKDDYIPHTSEQVLSTMIRKDLEDDGAKVFGNSLGQVGYDMLTTGANMIPAMATGNPLLGALTMGASATGNAYQQDLNETGDKEKAKIYATTVGALEGTLQYLIGGIGKLGGTSAYINNAVSGVKNGALRFALEYGGKIGSEALEEGLQEIIDPVVKNAVHGTDEEVDWENVVYSALMGGLMGGVFGASEVASTHLNSNEYSVVEKEIENRIKAKETDDKKLTKRDKNKIREQVMSDLEKGRIDTDEIGKMFAEESYNEYMESVKKEEAELEKPKAKLNELKDELKSLKAEREKLKGFPNVQKAVDKTIKRTDGKILTLEKQIESIKNNSGRLQLQNKMDAEAFEKLKGTRLAESYHEKARRGQAIEVDIESYDNERARKTAQNFINYGANNSNASHDFLDLTTKLAKEGKYSYMFMTSKQLEESVKKGNPYGITEDASKVEAFVNENTKEIVIIMDANKSLSSLVGHEVTHTLESATLYEGVKSIAINLAKMRGEYDGRWESIQRRYKDYTEEEQMQELVSDLIGDYLFGDTEFIRNLSTENPNAFQKIYNEIKHILKLATAGSKEARELERLKKEFEKVWRENGSSSSNGIRYRLSVPQGFTTLSEYEKIWSNYNVPKEFKSAIIEEMDIVTEDEFAVAREEIFKEMTSNRLEEKTLVYKSFVFSANHVFYYDNYSETDFKVTKVVSIEPEYSIEIDEVFYEGIIKRYGEKISDRNKELGYVKESGVSSSSHDGYSEASRGNVGVFEEGTAEGQPSIIPEDGRNTRLNEVSPIDENAKTSSEDGVFFDAEKDVKKQYSLSENVQKAKDYFGTTFRVSEAGYLTTDGRMLDFSGKKFGGSGGYRSIDHRDITDAFDGDYGDGSYSGGMVQFMQEGNIRLIPESGGINLAVKPSKEQLSALDRYISSFRGEVVLDIDDANGNTIASIEYPARTYSKKIINDINEYFDNGVMPEQPSALGKFRYSLSEDSHGNKLTKEQQEHFKDSKVRDENGNLKVMYHGTPNGDYTIFKEGTYFTENKAYADVYQNQGASSSGYKKTATNPKTYEVYLDIKKPFDTRNPKEREIFESEYYRQWGMGTPLMESGLPDWMDGEDLIEFIQENGYDYDGLILDEGGVGGYGDEVQSRGLSYVVFSPEQVKNIDNKKPTKNPDIRYSLSENTDNNYLEAVKNGDLQVAQEMVEEVAKDSGYTIKAFHGTLAKDFTQFKKEFIGSRFSYDEKGFFFIDNRSMAEEYAKGDSYSDEEGRVLDVYLKTEKPLVVDREYVLKEGLGNIFNANDVIDAWDNYSDFFLEEAENIRADGIIIDDGNTKMTVVFKPNQIKSADTVTYDNFGNPIPLSRRFGIRADMRYRLSDDGKYSSKEYGNHIYTEDVAIEENALAPTEESKVAQILNKAPIIERDEDGVFDVFMEKLVDKGYVFEKLSKKTKNRELEAKYNSIRYADRMAQDFIGNGKGNVKALNDIAKDVETKGIQKELDEYLYHLHNIDRMSLKSRYGIDNKAVYGNKVTADVSRKLVAEIETAHPEFKQYAEEIYKINRHLRSMLVEGGVISQKTADLWEEMYPHYVPIKRVNSKGANVNVPLDTRRTGINAPIKRATGGSADIEPLLTTMADRVLQTYKAVAKNKFGIELKNTLNSVVEKQKVDMDNVLDGMEQHEELLQEGKNGQKPTFTVFENGERVTFEVDQLMYEALKPTDRHLAKTYKIPNAIANFHRNVVTQYNPSFMIRNPIKDTQDVLINSQHPLKTYKNFPKAIDEIIRNGKWHQEYVSNGGEYNTYYERDSKKFAEEKSKISKIIGFPLDKISAVNEAVEKLPRLAEYIASREEGRSIEVSMLDSARVTTNFSAGADITKFANRNGATFLNASVQGAMQTYRNFTEAKMDGAKGWVKLATKFAVAGLPVVFLNNMIWDDDEEYDELSDYVKQNYYIVAKFGDGEFVRIPKGRTLAVIQNGFEQISNALTGDGEVDLEAFAELVVSNLAPNNPYENNILAPIRQVRNNETWYGEDLVPSRLQDIPDAEQYDESIDTFSKWLGEKIDYSPYKINYLIDQYSGAIGDTFLPMLTPEAESGDDKLLGKMTAPLRSAFITDSVLNNQTISEFYDTSDELTINANKSSATDEEILSSKYFNSVKSEIGKLYGEKREVQNKELKDSEKYNLNRDIQKKINSMSKEALESYDDVYIKGDYATVGDKQYRRTDDGWKKLDEDQIAKQNKVTNSLDIAPDKYWSDKEEYDYAYENPEKYAIAKTVGGYDEFMSYKKVLDSFHNDENRTAKEKKKEYIFGLDIDSGQQAILYRSIYSNAKDKAKYDADIKEYLYSRDDISYEDMLTILEWLEIK